jgi:hypothetical protein
MCHADQHWTEVVPLLLLEIRTAFMEELQTSVSELVYGELLRIPGQLLAPTADPVYPALITELRLRTIPAVSTTCRSATSRHTNYTLRTPCTFPCSL